MADARPNIERVKPPKWFVRLSSPLMRALATRLESMSRYLVVLHFTGRKTGRAYQVPIGYRLEDGRMMTLTNDAWRHNFVGGRDLEITYLRDTQPARGTLEADPQALADFYLEKFQEIGAKKVASDLGMRINLDRAPTRDEWIDALQRVGMARIWLDLKSS